MCKLSGGDMELTGGVMVGVGVGCVVVMTGAKGVGWVDG